MPQESEFNKLVRGAYAEEKAQKVARRALEKQNKFGLNDDPVIEGTNYKATDTTVNKAGWATTGVHDVENASEMFSRAIHDNQVYTRDDGSKYYVKYDWAGTKHDDPSNVTDNVNTTFSEVDLDPSYTSRNLYIKSISDPTGDGRELYKPGLARNDLNAAAIAKGLTPAEARNINQKEFYPYSGNRFTAKGKDTAYDASKGAIADGEVLMDTEMLHRPATELELKMNMDRGHIASRAVGTGQVDSHSKDQLGGGWSEVVTADSPFFNANTPKFSGELEKGTFTARKPYGYDQEGNFLGSTRPKTKAELMEAFRLSRLKANAEEEGGFTNATAGLFSTATKGFAQLADLPIEGLQYLANKTGIEALQNDNEGMYTEEELDKGLDEFYGYNPLVMQGKMEDVRGAMSEAWNEGNYGKVAGSLWELAKTPEAAGETFGFMISLLGPGAIFKAAQRATTGVNAAAKAKVASEAAKGNKLSMAQAIKAEEASKGLGYKALSIAGSNAGQLNYAEQHAREAEAEYLSLYGEEMSSARRVGSFMLGLVSAKLDSATGVAIMKGKDVFSQSIKKMFGEATESTQRGFLVAMAKATGLTVAKIAGTMVVEGTTEGLQEGVETVSKQYNPEEERGSVSEILGNDENMVNILTSVGAGAVGGAHLGGPKAVFDSAVDLKNYASPRADLNEVQDAMIRAREDFTPDGIKQAVADMKSAYGPAVDKSLPEEFTYSAIVNSKLKEAIQSDNEEDMQTTLQAIKDISEDSSNPFDMGKFIKTNVLKQAFKDFNTAVNSAEVSNEETKKAGGILTDELREEHTRNVDVKVSAIRARLDRTINAVEIVVGSDAESMADSGLGDMKALSEKLKDYIVNKDVDDVNEEFMSQGYVALGEDGQKIDTNLAGIAQYREELLDGSEGNIGSLYNTEVNDKLFDAKLTNTSRPSLQGLSRFAKSRVDKLNLFDGTSGGFITPKLIENMTSENTSMGNLTQDLKKAVDGIELSEETKGLYTNFLTGVEGNVVKATKKLAQYSKALKDVETEYPNVYGLSIKGGPGNGAGNVLEIHQATGAKNEDGTYKDTKAIATINDDGTVEYTDVEVATGGKGSGTGTKLGKGEVGTEEFVASEDYVPRAFDEIYSDTSKDDLESSKEIAYVFKDTGIVTFDGTFTDKQGKEQGSKDTVAELDGYNTNGELMVKNKAMTGTRSVPLDKVKSIVHKQTNPSDNNPEDNIYSSDGQTNNQNVKPTLKVGAMLSSVLPTIMSELGSVTTTDGIVDLSNASVAQDDATSNLVYTSKDGETRHIEISNIISIGSKKGTTVDIVEGKVDTITPSTQPEQNVKSTGKVVYEIPTDKEITSISVGETNYSQPTLTEDGESYTVVTEGGETKSIPKQEVTSYVDDNGETKVYNKSKIPVTNADKVKVEVGKNITHVTTVKDGKEVETKVEPTIIPTDTGFTIKDTEGNVVDSSDIKMITYESGAKNLLKTKGSKVVYDVAPEDVRSIINKETGKATPVAAFDADKQTFTVKDSDKVIPLQDVEQYSNETEVVKVYKKDTIPTEPMDDLASLDKISSVTYTTPEGTKHIAKVSVAKSEEGVVTITPVETDTTIDIGTVQSVTYTNGAQIKVEPKVSTPTKNERIPKDFMSFNKLEDIEKKRAVLELVNGITEGTDNEIVHEYNRIIDAKGSLTGNISDDGLHVEVEMPNSKTHYISPSKILGISSGVKEGTVDFSEYTEDQLVDAKWDNKIKMFGKKLKVEAKGITADIDKIIADTLDSNTGDKLNEAVKEAKEKVNAEISFIDQALSKLRLHKDKVSADANVENRSIIKQVLNNLVIIYKAIENAVVTRKQAVDKAKAVKRVKKLIVELRKIEKGYIEAKPKNVATSDTISGKLVSAKRDVHGESYVKLGTIKKKVDKDKGGKTYQFNKDTGKREEVFKPDATVKDAMVRVGREVIDERVEELKKTNDVGDVIEINLLTKSFKVDGGGTLKARTLFKRKAGSILGKATTKPNILLDSEAVKEVLPEGYKDTTIGDRTLEDIAVDAANTVGTAMNKLKTKNISVNTSIQFDENNNIIGQMGAYKNGIQLLTDKDNKLPDRIQNMARYYALQYADGIQHASSIVGDMSDNDIGKKFNVIGQRNIWKFRQLVAQGYIPSAGIKASIGRDFYNSLGIKVNGAVISSEVEESIVAGLAAYVEGVALANSVVTKSADSIEGTGKTKTFVKQTLGDIVDGDEGRRTLTKALMKIKSISPDKQREEPSLAPVVHTNGTVKYKNSSQYITDDAVEFINSQNAVKYKFKESFTNFVALADEDREDALKQLNYIDIESGMKGKRIEAKIKQKAINNKIEREFDILANYFEEFGSDKEFYIPWGKTVADRYTILSDLHYQESKIMREFMVNDSSLVDVDLSDLSPSNKNLNTYKAAVSQALDLDPDKLSEETVLEQFDEHIDLVPGEGVKIKGEKFKGLEKALATMVARGGDITDVHLAKGELEGMHGISALNSLYELDKALKDKKKTFKSDLEIEIDAITSGMMLVLMQIGTDTAIQLLEKGGFYSKSRVKELTKYVQGHLGKDTKFTPGALIEAGKQHAKVIEDQLKDESLPLKDRKALQDELYNDGVFKDLYSTVGVGMVADVQAYKSMLLGQGTTPTKEQLANNNPNIIDGKYYGEADAVRQLKLLSAVGDLKLSNIRNIAKFPVMYYVYGATMNNIKTQLVTTLGLANLTKAIEKAVKDNQENPDTSGFIDSYLNAQSKKGMGSVLKDDGTKATKEEIEDMSKAEKLLNTEFSEGTLELMEKDVTAIFGEAIENAFTEVFGEVDKQRKATKSVELLTYTVFKTRLDTKIKAYKAKLDINTVDKETMQKIVTDLLQEGFGHGSEWSRKDAQGNEVLQTQPLNKNDKNAVGALSSGVSMSGIKEGKLANVTANIQGTFPIANTGASSTINIHGMDGNLMLETLKQLLDDDIIGKNVYDAIILGVSNENLNNTADIYNRQAIEQGFGRSILVDNVAKLERMLGDLSAEELRMVIKTLRDAIPTKGIDKKNKAKLDEEKHRVDGLSNSTQSIHNDMQRLEITPSSIVSSLKIVKLFNADRLKNSKGEYTVGHQHIATAGVTKVEGVRKPRSKAYGKTANIDGLLMMLTDKRFTVHKREVFKDKEVKERIKLALQFNKWLNIEDTKDIRDYLKSEVAGMTIKESDRKLIVDNFTELGQNLIKSEQKKFNSEKSTEEDKIAILVAEYAVNRKFREAVSKMGEKTHNKVESVFTEIARRFVGYIKDVFGITEVEGAFLDVLGEAMSNEPKEYRPQLDTKVKVGTQLHRAIISTIKKYEDC